MAFLCVPVVYNHGARHVQWSKIEKLNPWRNGCHTNVAVTEQGGRDGEELKSDSNITAYMCTYLCMYFMYFVYSSATGCVCKTFQMVFFPEQLVNHIWGKNLDSFPPFFSAAFSFPLHDSPAFC